MADVTTTKTTEMTVNFRKLALTAKNNKRASASVKRLKKFLQKQFKTEDPVYISQDLNKAIFARGQRHLIGRLRIRVERGQCNVNPENKCVRVTLVDVNTFAGLKDSRIEE
ncbi:60S ribosomal protein L31 [Glugoides intestinalis]